MLDKIAEFSASPFRPKLSTDNLSPSLILLIERCWDDKPSSRLNARVVLRYLRAIPGFISEENIVDSLMRRMAMYAEELERRIHQV